ncbi:bifunctional diaminohydroxyphosphoribosylaminopyrimidine deaminase/5-amino-6-(5-phosphoribosylamino)uracil reductase RibD [Legionella oakridgensis]|uniref:Riboflavin biosynthesis protein RibD n=2 Tax=Legionella oakridgensis TaxID=29423 RepID=W0BAV9_9GAMM|nr:bifunctional diaminohydroxyphosphoribosylaminopyrimidine deaminase/5-amino-6-(5-phosphoribosylamino)uracil reductase RibD [Legionella oakridgensis]AHE66990.1 riboflavin biosynthesis protein RibD [Legionella oakridgensis ATCC 33761 = DSM 21215]ETO93350.1 riboflavin biosynthesis protein RibD [Legionella oakridgensis RV-2-2007]KTD38356.1 riboflavin biosynthesis protein RibD [Legionella oakridgensis]STY20091.1 riboflavin biosynthesis protein [Legionella longbeachae]
MHKQFLLAALEQALHGRGFCAPNPSVGAVAVQNGTIIAQARHHGAGTPHAEQLLLNQLPANLTDITLYVTLEPCNHWGRTPPCVDAIINYGVKRVVYGYSDPNPIVAANETPKRLQEKNIEVIHYPLPEIDEFYLSYHRWMVTGLPWVTAKIAQTLDGKIAGKEGKRVLLSNSLCSEFTHQKRLQSDVILTTARTINQDDPLLNVRLSDGHISKPIAIIDGKGILNPKAKLFAAAKQCHIYYNKHHQINKHCPNSSYYGIPTQHDEIDLMAVIKHLGEIGYHDVWVEAGGRLFSALHRLGLVQRSYIYIVPSLLGESATTGYPNEDIFTRAKTVTWQPMGDNMIVSLEWQREEGMCLPA